MKRRALVGLLALTGSVAVVGSGFASWYFGHESLTASSSIGVYTTVVGENIGTLTADAIYTGDNNNEVGKGHLWVIADQGGYKNASKEAYGLFFNATTEDHTTITKDSEIGLSVDKLTATYSISETDYDTLRLAGLKGTFTATLKITDKASTYIQFVSGYDSITPKDFTTSGEGENATTTTNGVIKALESEITYTYDIDFTVDTTGEYSKTFSIDVSTTDDGQNKLLQYKANQKPTTKDAYNTMKDAIKDGILTVNYSFAVSSK